MIPGHWSSSNESVISISKTSGEARAHAEGNSQGNRVECFEISLVCL